MNKKQVREEFVKDILKAARKGDWKFNIVDVEIAFDQAISNTRKEVLEFIADERDKVAKTTNEFNQLDDEYKEGYYIAMNTVMKYLQTLKNK